MCNTNISAIQKKVLRFTRYALPQENHGHGATGRASGACPYAAGQLLDGKMEASTPKWMLLNISLFNCPYKNASPAAQTGGIFFCFIQSLLFRLQILHYRPSRCLFR